MILSEASVHLMGAEFRGVTAPPGGGEWNCSPCDRCDDVIGRFYLVHLFPPLMV